MLQKTPSLLHKLCHFQAWGCTNQHDSPFFNNCTSHWKVHFSLIPRISTVKKNIFDQSPSVQPRNGRHRRRSSGASWHTTQPEGIFQNGRVSLRFEFVVSGLFFRDPQFSLVGGDGGMTWKCKVAFFLESIAEGGEDLWNRWDVHSVTRNCSSAPFQAPTTWVSFTAENYGVSFDVIWGILKNSLLQGAWGTINIYI